MGVAGPRGGAGGSGSGGRSMNPLCWLCIAMSPVLLVSSSEFLVSRLQLYLESLLQGRAHFLARSPRKKSHSWHDFDAACRPHWGMFLLSRRGPNTPWAPNTPLQRNCRFGSHRARQTCDPLAVDTRKPVALDAVAVVRVSESKRSRHIQMISR